MTVYQFNKTNSIISQTFTIIMFFMLISCVDKKAAVPTIQQLENNEEKTSYLEKIMEDDQKVRNSSEDAALILKYGKDSKEAMAYVERQWAQDEINLEKVEAYLSEYGHPEKAAVGEKVASVPWMVVHHQTDNTIRNKHFETLYNAYLEENISDTQFSLYLGRTYEFTFRKRFIMESPFRSEDEIDYLIKALNLEERKIKVDQNKIDSNS